MIPELRRKSFSCIGQSHKVVLALRKEAPKKLQNEDPSCIGQDHIVIQSCAKKLPGSYIIRISATSGKAMKL